eukprot:UN10663
MHGRSEQNRYAQELIMWDLMSTEYLLANLQLALIGYLEQPDALRIETLQFRYDLVWTRFGDNARILQRPEFNRIDAAPTLQQGGEMVRAMADAIDEPEVVHHQQWRSFIDRLQLLRGSIKSLAQKELCGCRSDPCQRVRTNENR